MPNNDRQVIAFLIKKSGGKLITTSQTGSQYYNVQGRKIRVSDHSGHPDDKQVFINLGDEDCIEKVKRELSPITRKL